MSEAKPQRRGKKTQPGPGSGSFKVARVQVQELGAVASQQVFDAPSTDLLGDELLLERLTEGETELYEPLMRRAVSRLFRLARGISGSGLEAEDIVRGALVAAHENLVCFDRRQRFADWVSRIVIHGALARIKHSTRDSRRVPRWSQDVVRQLENAVDELPDELRVAFTVCVLDQMPVDRAAETLGTSAELLQVRTFRARLSVRRKLGVRFDDAEARAFGLELGIADDIVAAVLARLGVGAAR